MKWLEKRVPVPPPQRLPSPNWIDDAHLVLGNLEASAVILDVGAHIGNVSRALSRKFPRALVQAYEPASANFEKLSSKSKEFPRIRPVRMALSDVQAERNLFLSEESTTHSLTPHLNVDAKRGAETITVSTLAAEASRAAWPHISILKIDTEGHDLNVLEGGRELLEAHRVSLVMVECGFGDRFVSPWEMHAWLDAVGYRLFGIYDQAQHWSGRRDLEYMNLLFISRKLVIPV